MRQAVGTIAIFIGAYFGGVTIKSLLTINAGQKAHIATQMIVAVTALLIGIGSLLFPLSGAIDRWHANYCATRGGTDSVLCGTTSTRESKDREPSSVGWAREGPFGSFGISKK